MPLDLLNQGNIITPDTFNELRVSLIGNKDLKYKLVGDITFIQHLVEEFNRLILEIVNSDSPVDNFEFLEDLEKKAVILNILCTFIIEVNTNKNDNITKCLRSIEEVINPLIQLLNRFVEKFIPQLYATQNYVDHNITRKVGNLIGYSLDILLGLANIRNHFINSSILWRFITSLLIVTDSKLEDVFQISSVLLIKLLKLVPLLLSQHDLSNNTIITLLTALLNRLANKCDILIKMHFEDIVLSPEILHQMAFEDPCLPNIELSKSLLRRGVNASLLLELITCTAQILSFLKANDYDVTIVTSLSSGTISKARNSSTIVVLPANVYLSLLLLVKYEDRQLSLAALNLVSLYLNTLRPSKNIDDKLIFNGYKKLFPRIIAMLDLEDDFTGYNKSDKRGSVGSSNQSATAPSSGTGASLMLNKSQSKRSSGEMPTFFRSPARILADLCAQYPLLNDEINDSNLDFKLVRKLEASFKSSQLLKALKVLKSDSKNGKILVDFTLLLTIDSDESDIADLLLLLSVYTNKTEEYRSRIVNQTQEATNQAITLPQIIFEIIDNYYFLLTQLQLVYRLLYTKKKSKRPSVPKSDLPWFGRNLGIIRSLMDSEIYTNCFYFARSISRSVATLRTFFVECNAFNSFIEDETHPNKPPSGNSERSSGSVSIGGNVHVGPNVSISGSPVVQSSTLGISGASSSISSPPGGFMTNLLEIIHSYETLDQILDFFYDLNKDNDPTNRNFNKRKQINNRSICIGLLANFILDFSSFRYIIIGYENVLSSLSTIYQNSLPDYGNGGGRNQDKVSEEEIYQRNVVQLKILQVIQNFMFNESTENKKELLEYFALIFILKKASYGIGLVDSDNQDTPDIVKLKIQQKIVAFEILRNFTAGSPNFNTLLINAYEQDFVKNEKRLRLPTQWFKFLSNNIKNARLFLNEPNTNFDNDETLTKLMQNDDYVKLLKSINFIENHKYAIIDNIKRDLFPNEELLLIWLRLLSFTVPESLEKKMDFNSKVALNTNLNAVKASIVWVIINLTWRYSTYGSNIHECTEYEVYQTVDSSRHVTNNQRIYIDDSDDSEKDKPSKMEEEEETVEEPKKDDDELTVQERAKYLDKLGFTSVIMKLINHYTKQATTESDSTMINKPKRFDIQNSHDILEKLQTALRQLTTLQGRYHHRSGSMSGNSRKRVSISGTTTHGLNLRLNESNNQVDVVEDLPFGGGSDMILPTSRRRSRIQDDSDNDDNAGEDDDDGSDDDMDIVGMAGGDESNEDEDDEEDEDDDDDEEEDDDPHEYWVM